MEANNILTASMLDILFEGKNKDYGAYELRKTYNKRVSISLIITMGIIAIMLIGLVIANNIPTKELNHIAGTGIVVHPPPEIELPPPPPPVQPPPRPPVATIAFPPPVITIDELVVKPPKEIEEILNARIDLKNLEGTKDPGFINPPTDFTGSQVLAEPAKRKNDDPPFLPIEINASFPGGTNAWLKYIKQEIEMKIDEFTEDDFGTCIVKFIVDKTGKVSHVEATTMKGTKLAEIAVNAVSKGPDWIPAQQNGCYVNAYRLQPVVLQNPYKR